MEFVFKQILHQG